jgi:hypothetical protein
MIEVIGYIVLAVAIIAVVGVFIKVLSYALDTITKNDD